MKDTQTSFAASILIDSRTSAKQTCKRNNPASTANLHYLQSSQDLTHNFITHQPPNQKSLLQTPSAEGSCFKRCITAIPEGCRVFCHIQVDHKVTPENLWHWSHSNALFKTASFSSKGQRNLHKIHGVTCFSIFIVHFFKLSPGMLAPGSSCAMDFHRRFGKVTKSNRLRALHSIIIFPLIPMGIRLCLNPIGFLLFPEE